MVKSPDGTVEDREMANGLFGAPAWHVSVWPERRTRSGVSYRLSPEKFIELDGVHDLRIERSNRVAQIDHLAISRMLEVYVV
jgi:hypothetical protein